MLRSLGIGVTSKRHWTFAFAAGSDQLDLFRIAEPGRVNVPPKRAVVQPGGRNVRDPGEAGPDEIEAGIGMFLIHAPNHIREACRLTNTYVWEDFPYDDEEA